MIHHDMSLECLTDSCSTHHLGILICSSQQSRLTIIDQARYHTPSIPELWRHRQVDPCESEAKPGLYNEFKAGQGYIVKPLKKNSYDNLPLVKFTNRQITSNYNIPLSLPKVHLCKICADITRKNGESEMGHQLLRLLLIPGPKRPHIPSPCLFFESSPFPMKTTLPSTG